MAYNPAMNNAKGDNMDQDAKSAADGQATARRAQRRPFDREAGVAIAQALFHEHGYDGVGIADLTRALDINPPSLYAAYGSKAGLFGRCLAMYVEEGNLPADRILQPGRPLGEAISELFVRATETYTRSRTKRGCMVSEGMRAHDREAGLLAKAHGDAAAALIERFIAHDEPARARALADYVVITLRGLSAAARVGFSRPRLRGAAELAGQAFEALLDHRRGQP